MEVQPDIPSLLWQTTLVIAAAMLSRRLGGRIAREPSGGTGSRWAEAACLGGLLFLAAALRFPALEELPVAFDLDELIVAGVVHDLCRDEPGYLDRVAPHFPAWSTGSPRLAAWLVRAGNGAGGPPAPGESPPPARRIGSLRRASAVVGVLLVAVVYGTLRVLDGPAAALAGGAFAALSGRMVLQCRFGLQAADFSLAGALTVFFYLLCLRHRRRLWGFMAGLSAGLAMRMWSIAAQAVFQAPLLATLAGLAVRPRERWPLLHLALLPYLAGVCLTGLAEVATTVGQPPSQLLGHAAHVGTFCDPLPAMFTSFARHAFEAVACAVGLLPPEGSSEPLIAAAVVVCVILGVLLARPVLGAPSRLVLTAFVLCAFIPPIIARSENLSFRMYSMVLPLLFVAAGRGAAALREAVGPPVGRRAVVPVLVVLAGLPWFLSRDLLLSCGERAPHLLDLRLGLRLEKHFDVNYAPRLYRWDHANEADDRGLGYLEWAYPLHPVDWRLPLPERHVLRPQAFVVGHPAMLETLQALYPAGRPVELSTYLGRSQLFVASAEQVAARQGWRTLDAVPEGEPGREGRLPVGVRGAVRFPSTGHYSLRAVGRTRVRLSIGGLPAVEAVNEAVVSGWFLEGPIVVEAVAPDGDSVTVEWSGSPTGPWKTVPDHAVWAPPWSDLEQQRARWTEGRAPLVIEQIADSALESPAINTYETALCVDGAELWLTRWLPKPVWRVDAEGREVRLPAASSAATYRVAPEFDSDTPPRALACEGPGKLWVSNGAQTALVRLSSGAEPAWQLPLPHELTPPLSLCRLPTSGLLAIASGTGLEIADERGQVRESWPAPHTSDLAAGYDGLLRALHPSEGEIAVYGPKGERRAAWHCSELRPQSRAAVDPQGRLWVLVPETGLLFLLSSEGRLLAPAISAVSARVSDTRGRLHHERLPGDLDCAQDGTVFVVLDGRLMRFQAQPAP